MHGRIHGEFPLRDQPLDFDNGREHLTIHLTLLHRKCVGQKLLERFAIGAGRGTHTRSTAMLRLYCWVGLGGRAEPVLRPASRSLSPSECAVNSNTLRASVLNPSRSEGGI